MTSQHATLAIEEDVPRHISSKRSSGDRVFRGVSKAAGLTTLVILVAIGIYLLVQAVPTFKQNGWSFFTTSNWSPDGGHAGVLATAIGTVQIAVIAMVLAIPICILAALFLAEYAPVRLRRPLTSTVDLLAAVPAVIFGVWGFFFLQPRMLGLSTWLAHNLGFIPIFKVQTDQFFESPFIIGTVVALMMLPTGTAVMREVFAQTPVGEKEAALALGGSRWRMVRKVVVPFGRSGIIGGSMLALGRAFGEAISVSILISLNPNIVNWHILQAGGSSIGSLIATRFSDSSKQFGIPALMGAALVLFLMTLLVNVAASFVVRGSRSGKGGN